MRVTSTLIVLATAAVAQVFANPVPAPDTAAELDTSTPPEIQGICARCSIFQEWIEKCPDNPDVFCCSPNECKPDLCRCGQI